MLARDVMQRKVFTVQPGTTLRELRKLLDEKGISGAPVVGPGGDLIGMVSLTDLLGAGAEGRVEEIMTPYAVSLEEEVPVEDVARQMLAKRIHRVAITKDGRLSGIVSSMDMLRALLEERKGR